MDERLEKALSTANFMATLNLAKKTAFEEYQQSLYFYQNGCSFIANLDTISKVAALSASLESAILIDVNGTPVEVSNLKEFLNQCIAIYTEKTEQYKLKHDAIRKQRNLKNLAEL